MKPVNKQVFLAGGAVIVLAVAIFAYGAMTGGKDGEVKTPQTKFTAAVPVLVLDNLPVNPLCFITRSDEDRAPVFPVTGCIDGDIVADPSSDMNPMGENFISNAYISKTDPDRRGMVGYRYLGDADDLKALWVIENTGGTGVFTSLSLMKYDTATKSLTPVKGFAIGDRCNGGVAEAKIENGALVYERDVTPTDMMGLVGDAGRAILQTQAAQQLPSCAVCCYARAIYNNDTLTAVRFDERLPQGFAGKNYSDANSVEKCFDDLIKLNLEGGNATMDAEGFAAFVGEIEHVCLGRPEGDAGTDAENNALSPDTPEIAPPESPALAPEIAPPAQEGLATP